MHWFGANKRSILWSALWIVCLIFYVPILDEASYTPKLLGLSAIALIALISKHTNGFLHRSGSLFFLIVIIACSIPSLLLSNNWGDGLMVMARFALVMLLVAVFSLSADVSQLKRYAPKAAAAVLLLFSFWGLVELIIAMDNFILTHKATYSVTASFGHRNLFVQFLVLLMPISALGLSSGGRWKSISLASLLLALFLVIVLLNRTAWFTLFAYAVIVFGSLWFGKENLSDRRKNLLKIGAGFSFLSLVLTFLLVDELYTFVHHFETVFDFSKGTSRDRLLLAQRSLDLFSQHPFFGFGAGMWSIEIMAFTQEGMLTNPANMFYQRPHNDYLLVLSESGLFAGSVFMALHAVGVFNAFKNWRASNAAFDFAIALTWVGYIIASFTSYPTERAEYMLLFALLLTVSFRTLRVKQVKLWRGSLITVAIVVFTTFILRISGELSFVQAKNAQSDALWTESITQFSRADNLLFDVDGRSVPIVHQFAISLFKSGEINEAAFGFEKSLDVNPHHPETWNYLGLCAEKNGDLDSALQCFYRAVQYTTSYQEAWLNVASIEYRNGDWRKAIRSFIKADSAQSTTRYRQLGTQLSIDSLNQLIGKVPDRKMMKTLEAIRNTPEWSLSVIKKCALNRISFERQAYIDACFYMLKHCGEYEDCDLVDEIIDQYLPHGKTELNLYEE